ncbi:ankyrin repeats (3 copies) domain-containing protein [Sarocladium implicatum]|nr:ankyrin repeats (3 copies) domain-containing protein [Sarocladium implicatum]
MARLYLYTDLTLPQIVKIVHHCESTGQVPGKDSANKKLNSMFDQQPRWLRPNSSNMVDRLEALSNSPTRATPTPVRPRPHSASDPSPYMGGAGGGIFDFLPDSGSSPSPFGLSPASALTPDLAGREFTARDFTARDFSNSPGGRSSNYDDYAEFMADSEMSKDDDQRFLNFVRKTTFMSTSTDHTTGSFQELLSDKSLPYVQAVRRLVKRFTLPVNGNRHASPALQTDDGPIPSWNIDRDCPTTLQSRPPPLAGDFVSAFLYDTSVDCDLFSPFHKRRLCYCAARASLPASPWVAPGGATLRTQRLFSLGPQPDDISTFDSCGNTLLHHIASNDASGFLFTIIAGNSVDRILNARNTAGQTFMHLINASTLATLNKDLLFQLLLLKNFNIEAKDVYGRTVFHMLLAHGVPLQNVATLLQRYGTVKCNTRDAFGVIPFTSAAAQSSDAESQAMEVDGVFSPATNPTATSAQQQNDRWPESRIIEDVREAQEAPSREDAHGYNGLHSLARATLSLRSAVDRNNVLLRMTPERPRRGDRSPDQELDSSTRKMQWRYELAQALLLAGVDPNHYDKQGNTPLMAFAAELPEDDDYKTGPDILTLLVKNGAKVDARNRAGETALHVAVRCGRKLAVRTLFKLDANIHTRDADGRSLLDVADAKVRGTTDGDPRMYAHFEACRAWLSGNGAVQDPTVLQEWGS